MDFLRSLAQTIQGALLPLGGWGLFVAAALDSSFLSFAGGVDLWLVSQSALMPSRMPLFALAATAGSVAGCSALYFTIRKGEEAILERHRSQPRFARVRQYVEKYGAWSLFVISILPPPSPFKLCVATSGLLKLPYRKFVLALAVGRSIRYFGEGFLTVRYGQQAWELLGRFGPFLFAIALVALGVVLITRKLRGRASAAEG